MYKRIFTTLFLVFVFTSVNHLTAQQIVHKVLPEVSICNSKYEKIYSMGKEKKIQVEVRNFDTQSGRKDPGTLLITLKSETDNTGEKLVLKETQANSGIFRGTMALNESPMPLNNNKLEVMQGDRIIASFQLDTKKGSVYDTVDDSAWYRGPNWTFQNTGKSHIILIPSYAQITINGEKIEPGDFISVFYEVEAGGEKILLNAGGVGLGTSPGGVKYTGQHTYVAAWGSANEELDGLKVGEKFKWKIWRAKEGKEYDAVATYMSPEMDRSISNLDTYAVDGISGVLSLTAGSK